MQNLWQNLIEGAQERSRAIAAALLTTEKPEPKPLPPLSEVVEQARQEWLSAQNYYNNVSDSDLVDHAVYLLQAAEKKYMYLLKLARKEGITHSPYS
ncbi:hypothetical protein TcarDRAFT_2545 [Thermosinus carboxydivorans Nor1]|uniref:DUF2508 domain-containing protein n=1 Tax=Thermosinus carboxydivorans Nor1 TaxID=401526 RepID=A1HM04_9FIRM|nr:YaaL family protein [Thermosinus carboxydivorans]EAX48856.1 hypothetical protein TcarDRAFT_2545 [Thermosinus carboxydivorans Nor1]